MDDSGIGSSNLIDRLILLLVYRVLSNRYAGSNHYPLTYLSHAPYSV